MVHTISSSRESRADGSNLDVGECHRSIGALGFNSSGDTRGGGASSASNSGGRWVCADGIVTVEPQHLRCVVIPNTHDQDHSFLKGITHSGETSVSGEGVGVTDNVLLVSAELVGNRVVSSQSWDVSLGVLDDFAVLNIDATDLGESTVGCVVGGKELGDNGELGVGLRSYRRWSDCIHIEERGGGGL